MFRTLKRLLLPNSLDALCRRLQRRGGKTVLLAWNRGLGDAALGLFAVAHRIRSFIPDVCLTFLVRKDLADGFSMLSGVHILAAPSWRRNHPVNVRTTLLEMGVDPSSFDCIIEKPNPTEWVRWQLGALTPRLSWNPLHDEAWKKFGFTDDAVYIGLQPAIETSHGPWRSWPFWHSLVERLSCLPSVKVVLFGHDATQPFDFPNVIDLRGKTSLFELLSIIKNCCEALVVPDSGILSLTYYLDASFPLHIVSLWADPNQGVLKQAVASPNPELAHTPLIGKNRDLSTVSVAQVVDALFPAKPLAFCPRAPTVRDVSLKGVCGVILAGGQGSRLGFNGPKGCYTLHGKSLFEWLLEKVPPDFPVAVMTSPLNHDATVQFFKENRNFGKKVSFFRQEMHLCDGLLVPKGNGSFFRSFVPMEGIDLATIVPVDNPLANMADPALIHFIRTSPCDVLIKCVERESPLESMGALIERAGRIEVQEYMELDPRLAYRYSYTGMMAIASPFIAKMAKISLPMHWVAKKDPATQRSILKGEEFIFDCLPFASARALCFEKKSCYAPVKGPESVENVRQVLAQSGKIDP